MEFFIDIGNNTEDSKGEEGQNIKLGIKEMF